MVTDDTLVLHGMAVHLYFPAASRGHLQLHPPVLLMPLALLVGLHKIKQLCVSRRSGQGLPNEQFLQSKMGRQAQLLMWLVTACVGWAYTQPKSCPWLTNKPITGNAMDSGVTLSTINDAISVLLHVSGGEARTCRAMQRSSASLQDCIRDESLSPT